MNKQEKEDLIRALWQRYGTKNQLIKAVEELAELQKELLKALGCMKLGKEVPLEITRKIAEEKEDVKFMMEQLDLMYVEPVCSSMNEKLNNLANSLIHKEHKPTKEEISIEESMIEFFKTRYKAPQAGKKFWDDLRELSKSPIDTTETKPYFPHHSSTKYTFAHVGTDENGKKFFEEGYISPATKQEKEQLPRNKKVIDSLMYEALAGKYKGIDGFIRILDTITIEKCPVCHYPLTSKHKCDLDNLSNH